MAYIREGLNAYTREYFQRRLLNPFAIFRPFLFYLGLMSVERMTKLGRPNTAAVFGDLTGLGRGELRRLGHGTAIFWPYQKSEPADGAAVSHRGATPKATAFAEDNAGMTEVRWHHVAEPVKVGKSSLDDSSGPSQIMSIMDNALGITWEALMKKVNTSLFAGTLTEAQQNATRWENLLGIEHVNDNTTNPFYGRVSRTVETNLKSTPIVAGTDTDTTAIELGLIDVVNDGNANISGRASRSEDGKGCNLHLVHPKLFQPLREEAAGLHQIQVPTIPGNNMGGARKPAIHYGDNWITYDEDVTNTEMHSLRLEDWILEVDPRYNFQPQAFKLKSENEEGGEFYEWSLIHAKLRLSCRRPWLQVKTTALTAS